MSHAPSDGIEKGLRRVYKEFGKGLRRVSISFGKGLRSTCQEFTLGSAKIISEETVIKGTRCL